MKSSDTGFDGSIPAVYDRDLVPLLLQAYADDVATRVATFAPVRVLEVAAGTGAVTRALLARLPSGTHVVATDLNEAMLDRARLHGTPRDVEWSVADAQSLSFPDASFDTVVCQFDAMFVPDRPKAFAEARRVLAPGGRFHLRLWERLEANPLLHAVNSELASLFMDDPPTFMARVPHGCFDTDVLRAELAAAGFSATPHIRVVTQGCHAPGPREAAFAFCHGTPIRNEITSRGSRTLESVTDAVAAALEARFGRGPFVTPMQAIVVEIARSEHRATDLRLHSTCRVTARRDALAARPCRQPTY